MNTLPVINNKCPDGYIVRKSYKTKKGKRVTRRCIKSHRKIKRSIIQNRIDKKREKNQKTIRLMGYKTPKCKKGLIVRIGYIKKTKNKKVIIKPSCIKKRGLPNKYKGKGIGFLNKGTLGKYGYYNVINLSLKQRRLALKKAIKDLSALTVWRKLNAISVYNRNTNPKVSNIFNIDKNWVKNNYSMKMKI